VIYQLLSGRHPYGGLDAPQAAALEIVPQPISALSTRQNECLRRALALRREQRTRSMADLLQEFFQTTLQTSRARVTWRPVLLGVAALAALCAALAVWRFSLPPNDVPAASTDSVSERHPTPLQVAKSPVRKAHSAGKSRARQDDETEPPQDPFVVK
jgi:hypothetical protein